MTDTTAVPTNVTTSAFKRRSPGAVFFLPIITLGIYYIYWLAKTRSELKASGESIPTTWCFIVPILGFFWLYWLARGIKNVTSKESAVGTFLLLLLLASIGAAIVQSGINKTLSR